MFRRNYVNGTYTTIVGPLCTIIGSIARFFDKKSDDGNDYV